MASLQLSEPAVGRAAVELDAVSKIYGSGAAAVTRPQPAKIRCHPNDSKNIAPHFSRRCVASPSRQRSASRPPPEDAVELRETPL